MSRAEAGDPLELRVAMLRQISESSLDDARKFLLVNIVESYFELTDDEASRYQRLLAREQEVKEMEATWADKRMEKGSLAAQRRTLLRQIEAKFGPPSEETRRRVEALDSSDVLDTYLERILTASSVEKMGLG